MKLPFHARSASEALMRDFVERRFEAKTVLVFAYFFGTHMIDIEMLDAGNMDECKSTRSRALAEDTPVTTRYGSDVKITAECKYSGSNGSSF